jgi:hypothetical protein
MKKFTSGPWCSEEHETHQGKYLIRTQTEGYAPLAVVYGDKRSTREQSKANANLISFAPKLFELLTLAQKCFVNNKKPSNLLLHEIDVALHYSSGKEL